MQQTDKTLNSTIKAREREKRDDAEGTIDTENKGMKMEG